jgi:hypothetical protein
MAMIGGFRGLMTAATGGGGTCVSAAAGDGGTGGDVTGGAPDIFLRQDGRRRHSQTFFLRSTVSAKESVVA